MPAEADVLASVRAHGEAMRAGDANALIALYAEDWTDHHGATKDTLKERYQGMPDKSGRGDMAFDLGAAEVVVDGDFATITPVTLISPKGSIPQAEKGSGRRLAFRPHPKNRLGDCSVGCRGQDPVGRGSCVCTVCPEA